MLFIFPSFKFINFLSFSFLGLIVNISTYFNGSTKFFGYVSFLSIYLTMQKIFASTKFWNFKPTLHFAGIKIKTRKKHTFYHIKMK